MKHNPKLTEFAKELRNNMTKAENKLWYEFLRTYPIQFRRQVTVGSYILDFYCASATLAIELDGSQHYKDDIKSKDSKRTAYLEGMGIKVIRYWNKDILTKFDSVCKDIDKIVKNRL
ncbi:MAG: DUF559 domain-containing protein [Ruminococcus sp.]|nr:DUF559 domain-containing protein [Ruminococcus sp.]